MLRTSRRSFLTTVFAAALFVPKWFPKNRPQWRLYSAVEYTENGHRFPDGWSVVGAGMYGDYYVLLWTGERGSSTFKNGFGPVVRLTPDELRSLQDFERLA